MNEIISFLRDLSANNNRQWFSENKSRYQDAQARFNLLAEQLIASIAEFDPSVAGLTAKECTYRIYRDTRFSADKSPYKTHFGAFICPGGKKSGNSGYYFHVGTGGEGYPHAHMLAAGDYCCDPKALRIIREDIAYGNGEFEGILQRNVAPEFSLDFSSALKRVPAGFPADRPFSDYLRLRVFCLVHEPDNAFMLSPDVVDRTAALFKTTTQFLNFINRAIAFSREEDA